MLYIVTSSIAYCLTLDMSLLTIVMTIVCFYDDGDDDDDVIVLIAAYFAANARIINILRLRQ